MLSPHRAHFYRKIVAAKIYIDQHYAENIDVSDISAENGFSRHDFIRRFQKTYGITPYQYLKTVRLERAAELLATTELKIVDVCVMVGYSSTSSFSRLFHREHGQSPRAYQLSHRYRRNDMANKPTSYVPSCFRLTRLGNKQ